MNLEPIIQREVSQKDKNKYHVLTHIYGLYKDGTDEIICGAATRHRHREQTYGRRVGEEGDGGIYGESNMETYITICKIDSQSEFAIWLKKLKLGLCNNL